METPNGKNTPGVIGNLEEMPKAMLVGVTFGIYYVVAIIDLVTGYEISCTVFYLLAIGLAAWYIGAAFGVVISILSDFTTSVANVLTGERYKNHFAPYWDAAIVLSFYLIVVWLLRRLRHIQDTLEMRVQERTATLSSELAERKRLELEILDIAEREQQRIGRDIHDGLCQHLTGTALAEQYLLEKLSARDAPEVADADRVVGLIEDAIAMARGLAAGLSPIETKGEGLLTGLADLAVHFSTQFKVDCQFAFEQPVLIQDPSVTTHLYRIAQEAVHNAIRHGKASEIRIRLAKAETLVTLTISDNGAGLPADAVQHQGMGLRNMKYRASMIGGSLHLEPGPPGAIVTCAFREGNGLPN
jgi:signal transduction histidine kinase